MGSILGASVRNTDITVREKCIDIRKSALDSIGIIAGDMVDIWEEPSTMKCYMYGRKVNALGSYNGIVRNNIKKGAGGMRVNSMKLVRYLRARTQWTGNLKLYLGPLETIEGKRMREILIDKAERYKLRR